ncbi:MAG: hypothetical protein U5K43_13095 [Halofilum sp. (in: g-proteobacteria)]|nr:hypothetical protein [Halofilum sp. (in: g-proteobacteria)]
MPSTATCPCAATVLLEGEEEVGSRNLRPFLERYRDELAADVCVVSDTTMWDVDTPAITYTLRGLLYTEITCHGPGRDLHSGFYGGAVENPLNALTHGSSQSSRTPTAACRCPASTTTWWSPARDELAAWHDLDVDEAAFLGQAPA